MVSDALRIRQIMKYLVLNAIKFTQAGSVCIRLAVKEVPHTPLLTVGSAKDLKMKVRDDMEFSKATLEPMGRESSILRKEIEMLQTSTSSSGSDLPRNPSPYIVGQKRTHSKSGRSIENIENEQLLKQSNVSMSTKLSSEGWQGGREGAGMDSRREKASAYFDHQSTQGAEKLDGDFARNVFPMERGNFLQPDQEALSRQSSASEKSLDSQKSQDLQNCSESSKSSDDQILLWCEIVDTGVGIPKEVCVLVRLYLLQRFSFTFSPWCQEPEICCLLNLLLLIYFASNCLWNFKSSITSRVVTLLSRTSSRIRDADGVSCTWWQLVIAMHDGGYCSMFCVCSKVYQRGLSL